MAVFKVFLIGDRAPLDVQLYYQRLDDVMADAGRARFISGHMATPDEQGIFREIMIPTGRIQCVIEAE